MKEFFRTHKQIWVVSYGLIYLPWFFLLESRANRPYHVIHLAIDDRIPFVEYFIVPYFLWFIYIFAVFVYLFFKDKKQFYQYSAFAFTGMTLFLILCTFYPNGHLLRPTEFERHNIFTACVQVLYQIDTSTNIFPSLHVFNAVAAHIAVLNNDALRNNRLTRWGTWILVISISLSTVFLKQHSVADVLGGVFLALVLNQLVYHTDYELIQTWLRQRGRRRKRMAY